MLQRTCPHFMLATCSGLTAAILALGTGCGEARDTSDPLGDIAVAYRAALQKHPAVASPDVAPDTAATLRSLARRAGSASGNADPTAAAPDRPLPRPNAATPHPPPLLCCVPTA